MKALLILAVLVSSQAFAYGIYTQGYTRSNGTVVQGYERTAPDTSRFNNFSAQGQINPYTGSRGTVNPYGSPSVYGTQNVNWGR